jgi:hypothetical protein
MPWFVNLMEELGIECLVGHPAEIRADPQLETKFCQQSFKPARIAGCL